MHAPAVEHLHRRLEPLPGLAADDVGGGDPNVVEDHVAGLGATLAHLLVGLAEAQALRVGGDNEGRDAGGAGTVGARHQRERAGAWRVGDEPLAAVDDVVVADALGPGLDRRRVGAGVGLGQGERHDQLAARYTRQELALLHLGTIHQDALRPDSDVGAEHRTEGQRGLADLECGPALLAHRQADATVLVGDRQSEQAHRLHVVDDVGGHLVEFLDGVLGRHQTLDDEALHRGQQQVEGFGIDGHGGSFDAGDCGSAVRECRRALFEEGLHALVGVVAGEAGVQLAALEPDALGQRAFVSAIDRLLDRHQRRQ